MKADGEVERDQGGRQPQLFEWEVILQGKVMQ